MAHGLSLLSPCGAPLPMLILASITEPIVNFATNVIGDLGLPGIFLLMLLDSACIPTSSEAIMLFGGFEVSQGDLTMVGIITAGVLGNLVGSWIAYAVGYYGRIELLEKHGKWVLIKPHHIEWADKWFTRHGSATVFFGRMIPVVRTFISLPAGVARMPFWRFTVFTILGCIPWVTAFAVAGNALGDNWEDLQKKLHYVDYLVAALIVGWIVYLVVRRRRGPGEQEKGGNSDSRIADQRGPDKPAPDVSS